MKNLLLLALACLPILGFGQFAQEQVITQCDLCSIQFIQISDINSDGQKDVLAISNRGSSIVWWKQELDGSFARFEEIISLTSSIRDIKSADLDNDGDLDLVVADRSHINWYENEGNINFSEAQLLSEVDNARNIYAADLDNNGSVDVIYTSIGDDDKIAWYSNDGNANFGEESIIKSNVSVRELDIVDLDEDGNLDILSAENVSIVWYNNEGEGNFSLPKFIGFDSGIQTTVNTADMDMDGDLDIITTLGFNSTIIWYENDGTEEFSQKHDLLIPIYQYTDLDIADIDMDGDTDIFVTDDEYGKIVWYANDGTGLAFEEKPVTTTVGGYANSYVTDLNQDGQLDIFATTNERIVWYKNNGGGELFEEKFIYMQHEKANEVYAVDLDNDGNQDILSASFSTDNILWYKNDGTGDFYEPYIVPTQINKINNIHPTDLDMDGDIDILVAAGDKSITVTELNEEYADDLGEGQIFWIENDANGNLIEQHTIWDQTGTHTVLSADFDQDGDMDVLANATTVTYIQQYSFDGISHRLAWFENLENNDTWEQHILFEAGGLVHWNTIDGIEDIAIVDVDTDGYPDIVGRYSGEIIWYKNSSTGVFDSLQTLIPNSGSIIPVDLNKDGKTDILSFDYRNNQIVWYEKEGATSFLESKIIATQIERPSNLYTTDIDEDGDMDIFLATSENGIIWYENGGNELFSEQRTISSPNQDITSIIAVDLNKDEKLDILFNDEDKAKIAWHENQITTDVEAILEHTSIQVFPNPFQASVTFEIGQIQSCQISIFDNTTKLLQHETITNSPHQVDMQQLLDGFYFYQITSPDGTLLASGKLVKNNR